MLRAAPIYETGPYALAGKQGGDMFLERLYRMRSVSVDEPQYWFNRSLACAPSPPRPEADDNATSRTVKMPCAVPARYIYCFLLASKVAGNYQYQWARRMLCDSMSTMAGGMDKAQLKLRLSGLLGVELSDGEMEVLFRKYADP